MAPATVAAFWGVSFLFVITPGADWAYAISAGLRHRTVLRAVGGLLSGHFVATVIVAAGVGALLAGTPAVLTGLTVAGSACLIWLGAGMLAGARGVLRTRPSAARAVSRLSGIATVGIGLFLLAEQLIS